MVRSVITKRSSFEDGRYPIATCSVAYLPTTYEAYHDDELPWVEIPKAQQWSQAWCMAQGRAMLAQGWSVSVRDGRPVGISPDDNLSITAELPDYGYSSPYTYTMAGEIGPDDFPWEVVAELQNESILTPDEAADNLDWSEADVRIPKLVD